MQLFEEMLAEIQELPLRTQIETVLDYDAFWSDGQNIGRSTDAIMEMITRKSLERTVR